MAKQTDDLLTYFFDGQSNLLVQPMAGWLASSRRFANFATTYRDKIRKKLRTTQDQEIRFEGNFSVFRPCQQHGSIPLDRISIVSARAGTHPKCIVIVKGNHGVIQ